MHTSLFLKEKQTFTWSPLRLIHAGSRQHYLLFYLPVSWIIQDNLAMLQSVGENDKAY